MRFTLRGVKEWQGNEGIAYQGTLLVDGKRAFQFTDDGWGGELDVHIYDQKLYDSVVAYVDSLPPAPVEYDGKPIRISFDLFIASLLDQRATAKMMKRWCKTKTVFSVPGDKNGEFRTINAPYSNTVKAHILKKYPNATIMNETIK
jgi:hypothetical protein